MRTPQHRTPWIRIATAGSLGLGLMAVTACGGSSAEAEDTTAEGDFGSIDVPLSWLHTAEFAGLYQAIDNGYYEESGFDSVSLVAGGPSATPSTVQVATGAGLVGWSNPLLVASTVEEEGDDAPLKIIGSVFQDIPYTVITMSDNPATEPDDLIGMSIGVPPANEPVFNAFLATNDLEGKVEVASIQSDTQPFLAGEIDAYLGFATNELISLEMAGHEVESMMFVDHGLPFSGGSLVATQDSIEENREQLKAFLEASIRGWHDALEDPAEAARSTVEEHAADQDLDYEHQLFTAEKQAGLITSEWTQENGLFTMSEEAIQDTQDAIEAVGYDVPEELFDLTLLEEVYAENPDLIEHPLP